MNRRSFLAGAAVAATPVPAMAARSPQERIEAALAELKEALIALDPSIKRFDHDWRGAEIPEGKQCRAYLTAYNW
ncbi:MAG: hypothetical protein KJ052_12125 [Candidatus Hydrogenedentes bacterium]|nr:hypothetical protein [Candidatus Hydrogenedentota bacterium]